MTTIARADMELRADSTRFQSDLDKARTALLGSFREMQQGVGGLTATLGAFRGALAPIVGGAGLGLMITGLAGLAKESLSAADALGDTAQRLGVNVERLQELQHAARLSGASNEDLETGLRNLNRRLGEAAAGQSEAVKLFDDMGISVRGAGGQLRDTGDILGDFADRIAATASPAERVRLAVEAFGRSGTMLLPMLAEGSRGLEQFFAEAQRLGLVMDSQLVREAGRANDALETMGRVIKVNLLRSIGEFVTQEGFTEWVQTTTDRMAGLLQQTSAWMKALGMLPTTAKDRLAELRTEIENLEKSLRDYPNQAPFLRRPQEQLLDQARAELARLLEEQREVARARSAAARGEAPPAPVELPTLGEGANWEGILSRSERLREAAAQELAPLADVLKDFNVQLGLVDGTMTALAVRSGDLGAAFRRAVDEAAPGLELWSGQTMKLTEAVAAAEFPIRSVTEAAADWGDAFALSEEQIAATRLELSRIVQAATALEAGLAGVRAEIELISKESMVFGPTFNADEARASALRRGIADLLRGGAEPDDERVTSLRDELRALEESNAALKEQQALAQQIEDVFSNSFSRVASAITTTMVRGEMSMLSFRDIAIAALQDIAAELMKMALTKLAVSLIGGIAGAFAGGGMSAGLSAGWGSGNPGEAMAEGGIVTRPTVALIGEAGPEAVVPLDQLGGGTVVQIIDQRRGGGLETREGRTPDGRKLVQAIIRDEVKAAVGDGELDRVLGSTYGLRRQGR